MKQITTVMSIVLAFSLAAASQGRGSKGPGPESTRYPLYANVPAVDGKMLRLLTEALNAKHVIEIGTSTGISGMWFCMALKKTGGKLTTFELDAGRAALARAHFEKAGVDRLVTLVEGDAHQNITKLRGPVDVVFIDAEKDGYLDYLKKL